MVDVSNYDFQRILNILGNMNGSLYSVAGDLYDNAGEDGDDTLYDLAEKLYDAIDMISDAKAKINAVQRGLKDYIADSELDNLIGW